MEEQQGQKPHLKTAERTDDSERYGKHGEATRNELTFDRAFVDSEHSRIIDPTTTPRRTGNHPARCRPGRLSTGQHRAQQGLKEPTSKARQERERAEEEFEQGGEDAEGACACVYECGCGCGCEAKISVAERCMVFF